jgi:RHS repeat-associated protein
VLEDNKTIQVTAHFDSFSNLATDYSTLAVATGGAFVATSGMKYKGTKLTNLADTAAGTAFGFSYDRAGHISQAVASGSPTNPLSQNYNKWFSSAVGVGKASIFSAAQQSSAPSLGNLTYLASASTLSSNTIISDKTLTYDPTNVEELRSTAYPNPWTIQESVAYDGGTGTVLSVSRPNCAPLQLQYDAVDRLVAINPAAKEELLAYGPIGNLVQRILQSDATGKPTVAQFYGGADLSVSVVNGVAAANLHVLDGGVRVATLQAASSALLFYHRDYLGSVVATSSSKAGVHAQLGAIYRYDTYGVMVAKSETSSDAASEIGFTGGIRLSEGLLALGARIYYPALRQFLQPDNFAAGRYSYAGVDPVNRIDPTGHDDLGVVGYVPAAGSGVGLLGSGFSFGGGGGGFVAASAADSFAYSQSASYKQAAYDYYHGGNGGPPQNGGGAGSPAPTREHGGGGSRIPNELQPPGTGVGPMVFRTFTTGVMPGAMGAADLIGAIRQDINRFATVSGFLGHLSPADAPFQCVSGSDCSQINLNNVYQIDGPFGYSPYVRVTTVTATSFAFTTMKNHPEAGTVSFSAFDMPTGTSFLINVRGQPATPGDSLMYWGPGGYYQMPPFGYIVQGMVWSNFINNVSAFAGSR